MATQTHAKTPAKTGTVVLSPQEKTAANSQKKIDRFKKLATARMNRALKALDAVAALSNKRSYTYTTDQVTKITTALTASNEKVTKAFASTGGTGDAGFSL